MAVPPYAQPYIALPDAFTPEELDRIEQIGDRLTAQRATIGNLNRVGQYDASRVTQTAWMNPSDETRWLYARMDEIAGRINHGFFQFELTGFEPFQYSIYRADEGGHFDWHVDHGEDTDKPRKMSLSIQLSDPAKYQGCDLQMQLSKDICTAARERGTVIAFPAYVLHRVTPVIAGERKALVVWTLGPKFR